VSLADEARAWADLVLAIDARLSEWRRWQRVGFFIMKCGSCRHRSYDSVDGSSVCLHYSAPLVFDGVTVRAVLSEQLSFSADNCTHYGNE
jgi:hypothetical protein